MDIILTFKGKDMAKAFGPVQIVGTLMIWVHITMTEYSSGKKEKQATLKKF
jgi:hypothetical protein